MGVVTPNSGSKGISFACTWVPFPLTELPCPAVIRWLCLVLLYLVLPSSIDVPGMLALLLMETGVDLRERRGMRSEWEEERKGKLQWSVMYERRIKFLKR